MDKNTFINLYKSLVRPHLEYTNSVWSPYKKGYVEVIEKVQKRATKLVISFKKKIFMVYRSSGSFRFTHTQVQKITW